MWGLKVLSKNRLESLLGVRDKLLPQMEEFKYLGVKSEEKGERGSDKWIGAMSAVMHMLYWSLVVKRDLNRNMLWC